MNTIKSISCQIAIAEYKRKQEQKCVCGGGGGLLLMMVYKACQFMWVGFEKKEFWKYYSLVIFNLYVQVSL